MVYESSSPAAAATAAVPIRANEAANTRIATFRRERSRIGTSVYSPSLDGIRTIAYDQITAIRTNKKVAKQHQLRRDSALIRAGVINANGVFMPVVAAFHRLTV